METFNEKVTRLFQKHEALITRTNEPIEEGNGIFTRYKYPVVTAAHTPVFWRYDLNEQTNPYLMERIGMNAALNSGAIKWNGKYLMVLRMEGADRKSFFAVAESPNGVDNFRFWDYPVTMVGYTVYSVPNAMMIMHPWEIYLRLRLRQVSPVPRI